MASWAEGRLQDPGYKRFILAGLAWDWLCKQLEPYLTHVIEDLHRDLLTNGHTTPVCHTNASTYKEVKACLLVSCGSSVRLLENCHVSGLLRQCWRNSQIDRWEKQPWSLALLYMDPGKDPNTNITPGCTDISGVINLMQHCTRFTMTKNLVEKIRVQRNQSVHHSSAFEMKAAEFNDLIDDIKNLLGDPCVAPHVTGNVVTYLDNVKKLKMDLTFHDEVAAIRQLLVNMEQKQAQSMSSMEQSQSQSMSSMEKSQAEKFVELIAKHDDLKTALSEELNAIKHSLEQKAPELHQYMTAACNIQTTDQKDESIIQVRVDVETHTAGCSHQTTAITLKRNQPEVPDQEENLHKRLKTNTPAITQKRNQPDVPDQEQNLHKRLKTNTPDENEHAAVSPSDLAQSVEPVPAVEQNQALKMKVIAAFKQELRRCYSRPEFRYLNPLIDDDETLGYFIESVFVDVSLAQRLVKPILGKRGLEESIRQEGKPVQNINDMIPPPGGQKVLLTGFVGSGKTSLCLHWLHEWTNIPEDESKAIYKNIHLYDLVIFLRARALENSIQHSLANVMENKIHQLIQKKEHSIEAALLLELPTLIIIDGYDEANKEQKVIVDDLVAYKTLTHASVIVTSRPNFFHGKIEKWYDNLGFKLEQQLAFISKFKVKIQEEWKDHFEAFEERFSQNKNATVMFTSPMIAMTTCTMVAEGEDVEFESSVRNYMQLTEFLARRACFKCNIEENHLTEVMPAFAKAAYTNLVDNASFQFSRNELCLYISEDTLDNIIVKLGYLSVTKYTLHSKKEFAYTFIHKSWAEFTAARYVMSLPIEDRCTAVCQLFKTCPANLEVLRFALGLCSQNEPQHIVSLFKAAGEVIQDLDIDAEALQQQMEEIDGSRISEGSSYLLLLLTDVDLRRLPAAAVGALSRVCAAIKLAVIKKEVVGEKLQQRIDVSLTDQRSAGVLYSGLLLTTHHAQGSLHTVRQLEMMCFSYSPHSAVTRLPATLAACAPDMVALTQVVVMGLASATELNEVCSGLAASGAPRLTSLVLEGEHDSDLHTVAGGDMGPVARVVRVATQLTALDLGAIHCGEERQLHVLCAALEEAVPQLTHLLLYYVSVSAQQYSAMLLPALHRRRIARGARLQQVELREDNGKGKKFQQLKEALGEVADQVEVY